MNKKLGWLLMLVVSGTAYGSVTITTPTVNTGELIRAGDWNKIRADLLSLSSTIDILGGAWEESGGDIHYLTGKVGIGIATPTAQLNVYKETPAANETMFQIGTGIDADKFTIDEDGDMTADGTLLLRGGTVYDSSGSLELHGEDNVYVGIDWNNNDVDNRAFVIGKNAAGPGTNWSEIMRVEEDGNVGIGTTSPADNLHVYSASNSGIMVDSPTGAYASLYFGTSGTPNWALERPPSTTDLRFAQGNQVAMTLADGGNVGVGTTSPAVKLQVSGPGDTNLHVHSTDNVSHLAISDNLGSAKLYSLNGVLGFMTGGEGSTPGNNAVEQVRITSAGNVGIGTTTPKSGLQVGTITNLFTAGSDNVHLGRNIYYDGSSYKRVIADNESSLLFMGNNGDVTFYSNSDTNTTTDSVVTVQQNLVIRKNGDVGIGTPPSSKLDVAGTIRAEQICDETGANCQDISTGWGAGGSSSWAESGSDVARAGGKVGIGTTSPEEILHVYNGGVGILKVEGGSTGAPARRAILELAGNNENRAEGVMTSRGGVEQWFYGQGYNTANFTVGFGSSQAEYASNSKFAITTAGNVGIGTTSPSNKLHVSGNIGATGWIGAGCETNCETGGGYALSYADGRFVARGTTGHGVDVTGGSHAVRGQTTTAGAGGVIGYSQDGTAYGISGYANAYGVYGQSSSNFGVYGHSTSSHGGYFSTTAATYGLRGYSTSASHGGVIGYTANSSVYGILGHANAYSLYGNGQVYVSSHIRAGGGVYAGAVSTSGTMHVCRDSTGYFTYCSSDERLKKDINPLEGGGLETIAKLKPVNFKWKEDDRSDVGFIAQDVQETVPESVTVNPEDDYLTFNINPIVAHLVKGMQQLEAENKDLKLRLEALENK